MPSLRECKTSAEVSSLEFDNVYIKGFALYCDGSTVTICMENEPNEVVMPKAVFDRILVVYELQQISSN